MGAGALLYDSVGAAPRTGSRIERFEVEVLGHQIASAGTDRELAAGRERGHVGGGGQRIAERCRSGFGSTRHD